MKDSIIKKIKRIIRDIRNSKTKQQLIICFDRLNFVRLWFNEKGYTIAYIKKVEDLKELKKLLTNSCLEIIKQIQTNVIETAD